MPLTSLGEGGGSEKDSWKPLCTNKKQKRTWQLPTCQYLGEGEFSPPGGRVFKVGGDRGRELEVRSSLASLKEGGSAVLPRAA